MPDQNPAQPPAVRTLKELREAEAACRRCPLYRDATQAVPGKGAPSARLMLVGEQPGDREDLAGEPFVGPAGHVLDRALAAAGIPRGEIFVTNAVKHFKHQVRGKRRLHKRPNTHEIDRCRWWLEAELAIVKPAAVIALGATAARSVLGRTMTISRARQEAHKMDDGTAVFVTIHPSYLLRIRREADRERGYDSFVADMRRARQAIAAKAA